jgi:hypothetical protein
VWEVLFLGSLHSKWKNSRPQLAPPLTYANHIGQLLPCERTSEIQRLTTNTHHHSASRVVVVVSTTTTLTFCKEHFVMTFHESSSSIANNKSELFSISMDEYVIVEQSDEIRDDDRFKECDRGSCLGSGEADDASYDYCEDVCPNDEEEEDDGDDENSVVSLESEAVQKDNFILSVPSGLMKDLDEAHAAAKLACSSAEEAVVGADDSSLTEEMEDIQKSVEPVEHKSSMDAVAVEITSAAHRTKSQVKSSVSATSVTTLSRASNKKRRKQLKLVKKAQAAASAAQALSARAAANAKTNKGKKVAASPVSSSSLGSRKVANIAVTCALETMASYRKEVLCSSVS